MGLISLLLSLVLLVVYRKTVKYNSISGVIILLFLLVVLYIRTKLYDFPSRLFVESTLAVSGILTFVFSTVSILFLFLLRPKIKKVAFLYAASLFIAYIPFGFIQHLFFSYVFLETIYFLTNNLLLSVVAGSVFYSLFHINKTLLFTFGTFFAGLFWSFVYLKFGNIVWPSLSLAIVGSVYYSLYESKDAIKRRLQFNKNISKQLLLL